MIELRPSFHRALIALSLSYLAACSAQGTNGSSPAPFVPDAVAPLAGNAVNLCTAKLPGYTFEGACAWKTLTKKSGGTLVLAVYKSIKVEAAFGAASSAPASYATALHDATGKGDITGKVSGKTFPLDKSVPFVLVYLDLHDGGSAAVTFAKTPKLTVTVAKSLANPGGVCGVATLVAAGGKSTWKLLAGVYGTFDGTGTSMTIPASASAKITVAQGGDAYAAIYCSGY